MSKKLNQLLMLTFLLVTSTILVQPASSSIKGTEDSWATKAPMQMSRSSLGVAVVDGKIYAIGGFTKQISSGSSASVVVGTNEEYNPETDTWIFKSNMPTARFAFAIAVYQNKIYCIGGSTGKGRTGVTEVYDPKTDTWETKEPMPTPRSELKANIADGKIYLIGGIIDSNADSGFSISALNEVYDPVIDSWVTKTAIPNGATNYASAVSNGKIYFMGGLSETPKSNLSQIYNPKEDTWSVGSPSPSGIRDGVAVVTSDIDAPERIYVLGVTWKLWGDESPYAVKIYDPVTDNWTFGADIPTVRHYFGVAIVNDLLYVIGGSTMEIDYYKLQPYPVVTYAMNEQYTPFGYGTVPPEVTMLSPLSNKTYSGSNFALNFTVNKPVTWLGYSLDGKENVNLTGNITLSGLPDGSHYVTIYAKDEYGNVGASETITFTLSLSNQLPEVSVLAALLAAIIIAIGSFLIYRRKRANRRNQLLVA